MKAAEPHLSAWCAPDNDNKPDGDDAKASNSAECEMEMRPTHNEILSSYEGVKFKTARHARLGGGGPVYVYPIDGDIEWAANGAISRIGKLRFAIEDAVAGDGRFARTRGAILAWNASSDRAGYPVRETYGPAYGPELREDGSVPLFPLADEPESPEALVTNWKAADDIRRKVGERNAKILDVASRCANFNELGEQFGYSGKAAERQGQRLLLDATKNLAAVFERMAA